MKHKIVSCLPFFLFLLGVMVGCDSDNGGSTVVSTSPDVAVASFELVDNDSVLDDLSDAFFSIDLVAGTIYNADSLPYGTDVSEIAVTMTFASTPASVTIHTGEGDSIDYFANQGVEMDFTTPAKMLVVAPNAKTEKMYTLHVNVHSIVPDSLYWKELSSDVAVPTTTAIQAMKVVNFQDKVLALVESNNALTCYTAASVESDWASESAVTGAYDINTLQAGEESLYILDKNQALYTSNDGVSWTATGETANSLIGVYPAVDGGSEQLLLVTSTLKRGKYVAGALTEETAAIPTLFPVSGCSNPILYASKSIYSSSVLLYVMGGETASGALTNALWAYDGKQWSAAPMNNIEIENSVVTPRKGATLIGYKSYPTYEVFDYPEVYDTWFVMGGVDNNGKYLADIYSSMSKGVRWEDPSELLCYPAEMAPSAYMSVIVQDNVVSTRGTTRSWQLLDTPTLPMAMQTRVVAERTAPFIYLFGGENKAGEVANSVWRGVIERLTFAPIE